MISFEAVEHCNCHQAKEAARKWRKRDLARQARRAWNGERETETGRQAGGNLTGEAQNRTTCWVFTDTHRSQSGESEWVWERNISAEPERGKLVGVREGVCDLGLCWLDHYFFQLLYFPILQRRFCPSYSWHCWDLSKLLSKNWLCFCMSERCPLNTRMKMRK